MTQPLAGTEHSPSQAVRVSAATYSTLKRLAAESGKPIVRCLDDLVQDAYRRRVWQRYAEANRRLQTDPDARAAFAEEQAIWATADADGLDADEGIEWDESLEDAASW